ncbi:MAG: hypothetical protein AAFP77_03775 [Bacteroidota bacterium]
MRIISLFVLISLLVSQAAYAQETLYLDTLEVEIGDNTKVIFLAKSPADFAVIDRYDLNFLFDELWRMRQEGITGEEELDRRSAEELRRGVKAPQVIEAVASGLRMDKWFLTPTMGLTIGGNFGFSSGKFLLSAGHPDELQYSIRGEIRSMLATEVTVGNSLLLKDQGDRKWRLRLGVGFSLTEFRLRNIRRQRFQVTPADGGLGTDEINELTSSLSERVYDRTLDVGMLFLEVGPYYEWRNRHPEGRWAVSAGVKAGLAIGDGEGLPGSSVPIYEWGESQILLSQNRFQYALSGHLGYSFANLFVNYYPVAFQLSVVVSDPDLQVALPQTRSKNYGLWVLGTRFGF